MVAGDRGFEGSAHRSRPSPARGYCWGSIPRIPEVALDCRTEAEGTEGLQNPEVTLPAEGQVMRPKVTLLAECQVMRP